MTQTQAKLKDLRFISFQMTQAAPIALHLFLFFWFLLPIKFFELNLIEREREKDTTLVTGLVPNQIQNSSSQLQSPP